MRFLCYAMIFACLGLIRPCDGQTVDVWEVQALSEYEHFVSPALVTADTLKHKLFDDSDVGSHNAASFYYRACLKWATLPKSHRRKLFEMREAWFGVPIAELPSAEVEKWLENTGSVFKDLDKGLSGDCDWGISDGEMTYAQQRSLDFSTEQVVLAEFGDVLRLRARLYASKGKYQAAVASLADCIKLAKDAGKFPAPLLSARMTSRIAFPALDEVNELAMIQGSPNLLAALQTLPRPVADYLSDIKQQHRIIERSFQFLDNPQWSDRTNAQWRAVFIDGLEQLGNAYDWNLEREYPNSWDELVESRQKQISILFAKLYPVAKRKLIESGWDASELDEMPVGKVIAIQTKRVWDSHVQLLNGIENLPAEKVHDRAEKLINSDLIYGDLNGCFPLNLIILLEESLLRSRWQLIEISMNMQLLRDHLARTGEFPTTEQFKKLNPLPNPQTGLPFQYRKLDNGHAQLQSAPVRFAGSSDRDDYVRERYTIKKAHQK